MKNSRDKPKTWMTAREIMEIFNCSMSYAYGVIRKLNDELKEKGYLVVTGKVSRKYFQERFYG